MKPSRRTVLLSTSSLLTTAVTYGLGKQFCSSFPQQHENTFHSPTHSIIPVVGDGKWIWNKPPAKERGYLEPRSFDLTIEIHAKGKGNASEFTAFTAAPVSFPEQEIVNFDIKTSGCEARVQQLSPTAACLQLVAGPIESGQMISAIAQYRLKISKSYFGFQKDMFPEKQVLPREANQFLGNTPGIQTSSKEVREVVKTVVGNLHHPWDIAQAFHRWVWENIKGRPQEYTNVITAIRKRVGDCEERAAVFVALCRACQIPARLVWVPNHNWAEILLADEEGAFHWIPCHTSAYDWFGWTGVHELLLQKGDRVTLPNRKTVRLIYDYTKCAGKRPETFFTANLSPVAEGDAPAGPGTRQKQKDGKWKLVGSDSAEKFMRD